MPKPKQPKDERQRYARPRYDREDAFRRSAQARAASPPKQIDPRWLITALCYSLLAAMVFAYLSVCLFMYLGGWQRMLFPAHTVAKTPGIAFDPVRFDAAATGIPRLTGWWVPVDSATARTVLLLHDGRGSLAETVPTVELLHQAGVNVFAIDYRGFGTSDPQHPTEQHMQEDAEAALEYLVFTRHLAIEKVIPYGQGLGAVLAVRLAKTKPGLSAVVVENPDPDAFARVASEGQARLLPMRWLVPDHFDLAQAVAGLNRPALLIADTPFGFDSPRLLRNQAFFQQVTGPKMTVTFGNPHSESAFVTALNRFLDEYVPN